MHYRFCIVYYRTGQWIYTWIWQGTERTVTGMADYCTDNRFEVIERYKKQLIENTNIETSSDEMAVIDSVLFRFWQMGWLAADTNVATTDTISRQAALKGLEDLNIASFYEENEHSKEAYTEVKAMLNALPPAQPERDDCDTCKHHGYFGSVVCNNCRVRYPSYWESREGGQDGD